MSYLELLRLAAPETIVVLTALAVLATDLLALRELETRVRFVIGGMMAGVGCAAAIASGVNTSSGFLSRSSSRFAKPRGGGA